MLRALNRSTLACAISALAMSGPAWAAADVEELKQSIRQLQERVKQLEQFEQGVNQGLNSDSISENEPELTSRLKAVEKDALDMKKAAGKVDALDGLAVGASLTTVAQRPDGFPHGVEDGNSQLNYRADIMVQLPLEAIGDTEQKIFAHFRMGQGLGLNNAFSNMGGFASAPDAVAFRASGANPDDSVAILGEAWYQASLPLPLGGFKPRSRETLQLTFGKMDLFGFFDQNAGGGDETRQFLNSVFVHNPLLDAGGQIGMDRNGFQPGFVASYFNYAGKPQTWRLSLGLFGTGKGANYQRFFSSPLIIAQAETSVKPFEGLTGNYRVYAWSQGQGKNLSDETEQQSGWGISLDQRLGDSTIVFGRYGQITTGSVPFDRALTLGLEYNGSDWGRGADAIGVASAWLRAGKVFEANGGVHDLLGNDDSQNASTLTDNINYTPQGAERVMEIYYRYHISKQFELTPDFQLIQNLGGDNEMSSVRIIGLRAQLTY